MEKKRNIVEWAMHYRSIVILITSCLVAFGIFALYKMNKNEFPDFTVRQGVVVAVYPGATAQQVEEEVTKPLENYIFTFKEVKKTKTKSFSRNGMCIIQIELNDDIAGADKDNFWSKFKLGVQQFKSSLPTGVLALQVRDDFGDTSALLITIESNDKTYRELHTYMDDLKDRLRTVESVGRMTVYGERNEQISVYLDAKRLSQYGINQNLITAQLLAKGFTTTSGTLKSGTYDSPIEIARTLNLVNDVEQMVVYSDPQGNVTRLKDVATVRREYAQPSSYVTNNGKKCLVLSVEMKKGRSITEMGTEIDQQLTAFQKTLPQEVSMYTITNQSKVVGDSVSNFLRELLIAIVAVIVVVILLMPLRVALVAASTIPLSIFISLGLFYAFGIELNTVSLAALIVTLGMIVDNSIVIIDNYMELLGEGMPRWKASIQSATHFFKSIFTATLAISITFFPLLLTMTGISRDFLGVFPWSMFIVLIVSLLVAELLVPFMQFHFIREPIKSKGDDGKKKFSFLDLLQRYYDRLIDLCFSHPRFTIGVGVASVAVGALLMRTLPQRMWPTAERNQFAVEIYLPTGASLQRTAAVADSLEHMLRRDKRVLSIASFKGMASPRFQTTYAPQFAGTNYAQFIVNTKNNENTVGLLKDYTMKYQAYFPDAYVQFKQLRYGDYEKTVELRLSGSDWALLKHVADSITAVWRANKQLTLVRSNVNEPQMVTQVTLNQNEANRLAVSNAQVALALASRYNSDGMTMSTIWNGDYGIPVRIKGDKADRATINDLADEQIPVSGGLGTVPLRQIATLRNVWQDGQICHRNGVRTITVMAEPAWGLNGMAVTKELQKQLNVDQLPQGVSVQWGGEIESAGESTPKLVAGLLIGVVIIFFLMLWHFKRINTAVLLLLSLLMTFFGTALGVLIQGVDFSITCYLGIISLMGILVRNAIIMYDYAEELSETEGLNAREAIYTSAKRRMRPIFLTSAAASMGVIPMIIGGSGLWMPMGAVICYGTLITMLLILTVLPVAYWLMMARSEGKQQREEALEQQ